MKVEKVGSHRGGRSNFRLINGKVLGLLILHTGICWRDVELLGGRLFEHASAIGELDAAVVSTLSKHQKSNLDKVYMTELFPPILRVMAGFSNKDNLSTNSTIYHVPRALITLPWSDNDVCKFIFPKIEIWRAQFYSPQGDTSEAARNSSHFLPR